MEEWRPIPGYEGWYSVSSLGRIRRDAMGERVKREPIRKQFPDEAGYPRVTLTVGGVQRMFRTHDLLAAAFLGPKPEGQEVNHKDAIKSNCVLANLEYVTPQGNRDHAKGMGLIPFGERHWRAKADTDLVVAIRQARTLKDARLLGEARGLSRHTVRTIRNGHSWAHVDAQAVPEKSLIERVCVVCGIPKWPLGGGHRCSACYRFYRRTGFERVGERGDFRRKKAS